MFAYRLNGSVDCGKKREMVMSRLGAFILPNHRSRRARRSTPGERWSITPADEYLHAGGCSCLIESVLDIRTKVNLSEIQPRPTFARAAFGVATQGGSESGCEQFAIDIGQASLSQS